MTRNIKVDWLKGFALILVVSLHTAPFAKLVINGLVLADIAETIPAVGVPIFFMLAGYFYQKKNRVGYLKSYESKLLIPYVISVVFYLLLNITLIFDSNNPKGLDYFSYILDSLKTVTATDFYYTQGYFGYHLWYLPALMLAIYIGNLALKRNRVNKWLPFFTVVHIIGILLPVLFIKELRVFTRDGIFFGIFYVLLGMYLSQNEDQIERLTSMSKALHLKLIGLFSITSLVEGFVYAKYFDGMGDYYLSTIPLSLLLLGLAFRKDDSSIEVLNSKLSFLGVLGRNSLLIYLVHPFIIVLFYLLLDFINLGWLTSNMIWRLVYTPIVILLSYWLTLCINKLKTKRIKP